MNSYSYSIPKCLIIFCFLVYVTTLQQLVVNMQSRARFGSWEFRYYVQNIIHLYYAESER